MDQHPLGTGAYHAPAPTAAHLLSASSGRPVRAAAAAAAAAAARLLLSRQPFSAPPAPRSSGPLVHPVDTVNNFKTVDVSGETTESDYGSRSATATVSPSATQTFPLLPHSRKGFWLRSVMGSVKKTRGGRL